MTSSISRPLAARMAPEREIYPSGDCPLSKPERIADGNGDVPALQPLR